MEGSLLVLGNLLLDMIASVEDSYLEVNNLTPDSIQTASENHFKIYDEISKRKDVTILPGGSALNTVRMAQRILGMTNSIALLGAVGFDEIGKLLVDSVEKEGIKMIVQYVEKVATGRCACLLTNGGSERTMVTDLGAALRFSHDKLMECNMNVEWLEKAKFVYITGYFLTVSPPTALEVARRAKRRNAPVLLNLNAVWVTTSCKQEILTLLPFVDVMFGNEAETASFVEQIGLQLPTHSSFISPYMIVTALVTFMLEENKNTSNSKVVVMTRGNLPVICAENGKQKEYSVPLVSKDTLKDTTGAGDAFVGGGFLARYIQEKSLDDCIACGIWAATEELKGYGFILPSEIPLKFRATVA